MLISHVGVSGEDCLWDGASEMELTGGTIDLIGLAADNGGVATAAASPWVPCGRPLKKKNDVDKDPTTISS